MNTIALTTDFDADERRALLAAAGLASTSGSRLVTVHATMGDEAIVASSQVEELVATWGRSIEHVPMTHHCCDDVTDTVLDALRRVSPALVVAGTHGRSGWLQLFASSVAEGIARNVNVPTLVVPLEGRDLVSPLTGVIDLRRVVVPGGDARTARTGIESVAWLAALAGVTEVEVVLLHVEDGTPAPEVPELPAGLRITRRTVSGPLERAIVEVAREMDACAVVMATRGHDGVVDALAGSHTERVLRQVRCPVLSVPLRS